MVEPTKQYELFISYADTDRAWVEGYLLDSLRDTGVNYHSEAAFTLGAVRLLEFERAIKQSRRTLLVISSAYLADGSDEFISLLAQCYGFESATWPVIPLILEPIKLPPRLSVLVKLNATNQEEREESIEHLCAELQRPIPAPPPKLARPYPGMIPFREEDSNLYPFFGRDKEIEDMVRRLRKQQFLTVIGPSGSGKSSLVFAGLIPTLRRRDFGSGDWLFRTLRTGRTPLTDLTRLLNGNLNNPTEAINTVLATQPGAQRLLLVVDQFEETFTQAKEEAISFQKALLSLIGTAKCWVILTMRADFYSDLMESPLWQQIKEHRLEVTPLDETSLRDAIVKPAEKVGVFVESALVERLVTDAAGEPGVLPLVQETLALLWEKLERRFLPLSAYNALVLTRKAYGEHGEHPNGLQVAIADLADNALRSLENDTQRAIARRIFLRLVQFGEGRADTRRQQTVNELQAVGDDPQLLDQTLKHLADEKWRLLTMTSGEQNTSIKVDISHEALIAGWDTLRDWIAQRRGAELIRRQLVAKAQEWVRLGRSNGGLLDEVELVEAERWRSTSDAAELGYDINLDALVNASRHTIEQAKKDKAVRKRNQYLIIGSAVFVILGAIGVSTIRDWQKQQEALTFSYNRWSGFRSLGILTLENWENSLKFLNDANKRAIEYEKANKIDQALAYYRQIRADTSQLCKRINEEPSTDTSQLCKRINKEPPKLVHREIEEYNCNQKIPAKVINGNLGIEDLYQDSEESINRTIIKSKALCTLKDALESAQSNFELTNKNTQFGNRSNGVSNPGNHEKQFQEKTPLQITYKILMSEFGAKADLNNSGQVDDKIEANQIPCKTLMQIQKIWQKMTHNQCSWYATNEIFSDQHRTHYYDSDCKQLDGKTLFASVFSHETVVIERINYCFSNKQA